MKSNSVFLLFGAAVIVTSLLLLRLFTSTPPEVKESIAKKIEASRSKSEAPPPVMTPSPASTPTTAPAPTATPSATAAPAAKNSVQIEPTVASDFDAASASALASIPTRGDLAALPASSTHFTPKTVIEAADQVGRVSEMIQAHPELAAKGLEFYRQCAENEASAESIRVTCASEFKTLQKRSGSASTDLKIPKRIAALAERLSS